MADGGPGFVDVLHEALGGEVQAVTVAGPFGEPTPAAVLLAGATAYVESAQACGLHLTRRERAEEASTRGVGELVLAAVDAGAREVVVGLGGSGTTDGGAGLLAALGATADVRSTRARRPRGVTTVDIAACRARLGGVTWWRPATSTTSSPGCSGRPRPSGRRKASPRSASPSSTAGSRRTPRPSTDARPCCPAPAPQEAWATRCWPWGRPAGRVRGRGRGHPAGRARPGGRPGAHR